MTTRNSALGSAMRCFSSLLLLLLSALAAMPARADETIGIGGSRAVLLRPAAPVASVILLPGGDGKIGVAPGGVITRLKNNQLVRTRDAYKAHGLAVLVVDTGVNLGAAIDYMGRIKRPVIVVGTSRGTLRAANGIARGARPDALVLTSGFLTDQSGEKKNVAGILGSPANLPRTLVIPTGLPLSSLVAKLPSVQTTLGSVSRTCSNR